MVMTGGLFIIVLPTLFKNVMSLGYLPNSVGPFAKEMFSYLFGWVCARFFGIKWRPRAREPNEKKTFATCWVSFFSIISWLLLSSLLSSLLPSKPSQIAQLTALPMLLMFSVAYGINMCRMCGVEPSPALAISPVYKTILKSILKYPPGPEEIGFLMTSLNLNCCPIT